MKNNYRHIFLLSYSLAKANFKVRNEGSYLGVLWYLLNPLSFFFIFIYLRGALFSTTAIGYYPVYLMVGLIMMNFFNQAVGVSINLIRNNSGLIKSMKIHYEVFVLSTLFQSIFSHLFELLIVLVLFIYFHVSIVGFVWYAVVFIFFALFTLGACFFFTTIGLYFSDFGNIWSILSQLIFFATPVFYGINPASSIYAPSLANPLFYFLTSARDVAIYGRFPSIWIGVVTILLSICSLAIGFVFFSKCKWRFAEYV